MAYPHDILQYIALVTIMFGQVIIGRYGKRADTQLHNRHVTNLRDDISDIQTCIESLNTRIDHIDNFLTRRSLLFRIINKPRKP